MSHDKYVNTQCSQFEYHKMNVYYFDSMSTRIREFTTVKSVEFYPSAKFILDPSLIPQKQSQNDKSTCSEGTSPNASVGLSGMVESMKKMPVDRGIIQMKTFIDCHRDRFNKSQYQALFDVANMKPVDFLLIQGPRKYTFFSSYLLFYSWYRKDPYHQGHNIDAEPLPPEQQQKDTCLRSFKRSHR